MKKLIVTAGPPSIVQNSHQLHAERLYRTLNLPDDSEVGKTILIPSIALRLSKGDDFKTLQRTFTELRPLLRTFMIQTDRKLKSVTSSSRKYPKKKPETRLGKILGDYTKALNALSDAEFKEVCKKYEDWFSGNDVKVPRKDRSLQTTFIMDTDPIMAEGGLVDFLHNEAKLKI